MNRKLDYSKEQKRRIAARQGAEYAFNDLSLSVAQRVKPSDKYGYAKTLLRRAADLQKSIEINRATWPKGTLKSERQKLKKVRVQIGNLGPIEREVARMGILQAPAPRKRKGIAAPAQKIKRPTIFENAVSEFLIGCAEATLNGQPMPSPSRIIEKRYPGALLRSWIKMTLCGGLFRDALKKARAKLEQT